MTQIHFILIVLVPVNFVSMFSLDKLSPLFCNMSFLFQDKQENHFKLTSGLSKILDLKNKISVTFMKS